MIILPFELGIDVVRDCQQHSTTVLSAIIKTSRATEFRGCEMLCLLSRKKYASSVSRDYSFKTPKYKSTIYQPTWLLVNQVALCKAFHESKEPFNED